MDYRREYLFLWMPFLIATGIIIFFEFKIYPEKFHFFLSFGCLVLVAYFYRREKAQNLVKLLTSICILILIGVLSAQIRTILCKTTLLEKQTYKKDITGEVTYLSRGKRDYITVHTGASHLKLYCYNCTHNIKNGDLIKFDALLIPIQDKMTPSGYDFSKFSYFDNISANGRITNKPAILKGKNESILSRIREFIYSNLSYNLRPTHAEIASALVLGKRDNINPEIKAIFSRSGTSHLLAISGLHMSIVGIMFFRITRKTMCISRRISLEYDTKKIAAFLGILTAFGYLQLSGSQVSAQRAFIMTTTFFLSIIIERKPDILRSICFAATGMLILQPENLFKPGFQMSFFAVLAICSRKNWTNEISQLFHMEQCESTRQVTSGIHHSTKHASSAIKLLNMVMSYRITRSTTSIIQSSVLATIGTAPFVLYHFHSLPLAGILSNIIAIPLTTLAIIPILIIILIAMPFYDFQLGYTALSALFDLLITSMEIFSTVDLAYIKFHGFHGGVLIIVTTGLVLTLLHNEMKFKIVGMSIIAIGSLCAVNSNRPDIFISDQQIGIYSKNANTLLFFPAKKIEPKNFTTRSWQSYSGVELKNSNKKTRASNKLIPSDEHGNRAIKDLPHNIYDVGSAQIEIHYDKDDYVITLLTQKSQHSERIKKGSTKFGWIVGESIIYEASTNWGKIISKQLHS